MIQSPDRNSGIQHNPNKLTLGRLMAAGGGLLATTLFCANAIDAAPTSPPDDVGTIRVTENSINMQADAARAAQLANATTEPNYPATEAAGSNELPNSSSCVLIPDGGNVSNAIKELGAWPDPNAIQAPLGQVVGLYPSETAKEPSNWASVDEIVSGKNTSMDNVKEGNEVCVANSVPDLFRKPRSTPQSSIPSRRQMSQAGFSAAKGSQPARFQPIPRRG